MALQFTLLVNQTAAIPVPPRAELRRIEAFLLSQPGVLHAAAWFDQDKVRARVTISDDSLWTPSTLRIACFEHLGANHTPSEFTILNARPLAA